jgi:hypothetical protein
MPKGIHRGKWKSDFSVGFGALVLPGSATPSVLAL